MKLTLNKLILHPKKFSPSISSTAEKSLGKYSLQWVALWFWDETSSRKASGCLLHGGEAKCQAQCTAAAAQPASSPCSAGVAPEKNKSLLPGVSESPRAAPCHQACCFATGPPLPAEWVLPVTKVSGSCAAVSVLGLPSDPAPLVLPGTEKKHNRAMLATPLLNRGEGSAPSTHGPHCLLWATITLVCQSGTFLEFLYPFLPQK